MFDKFITSFFKIVMQFMMGFAIVMLYTNFLMVLGGLISGMNYYRMFPQEYLIYISVIGGTFGLINLFHKSMVEDTSASFSGAKTANKQED